VLFITDEVITGFGRTGKYFGIEHYDVTPDMMCFAKGITSGYAQLGGVMLSNKIHQVFTEMSKGTLLHGYTYSGHPVACAVALKNIEIIESEHLIANAKQLGNELLTGLKTLQSKCEIVGEVRGLGLMGAIEIVKNKSSQERFTNPVAPLIVSAAAKTGLICRSVVFEGQDTLVFAPPLSINKEELHTLVQILTESLLSIEGTLRY
jgi:adenosylmethionine-8-amino-7-oxononanoate aminotransferase